MREDKHFVKNVDWVTVFIYIALVLMGWFNIYAAVYNEEHNSIFDMTQRYGKQMVFIIAAFVLAFVVLLVDAKFFSQFAYPIYSIALVLLVAVLLTGVVVSGSRSWFQIGGISIQPSELAKFASCLALAKYLSAPDASMKRMHTKIVSLLLIAAPALLILLQPDAGSAIVYASFILVLFREGLPGWILVVGLIAIVLFVLSLVMNMYVLLGLITVAFAVYIFSQKKKTPRKLIAVIGLWLITLAFTYGTEYAFSQLKPHQQDRINVLVGKEVDLKGVGYNINQSKIAIGSGGFLGKGYLEGTQTKFNFVPEQSTDFIFCTVGEEWGFVGSTVVLGLFLFLILRIIMLAERQRSTFSRVYGYGVACILFFHVFVNIGMAIGLLPVIGIPLPFFSYGGSSLWSFTLLLFVFLKQDATRTGL